MDRCSKAFNHFNGTCWGQTNEEDSNWELWEETDFEEYLNQRHDLDKGIDAAFQKLENSNRSAKEESLIAVSGREKGKATQAVQPVLVPSETTWESITITVLKDELVEICTGDFHTNKHFWELGFRDRRSKEL